MVTTKPPELRGEAAARILEAADRLVGEVGYDRASIGDVAARAGVNKALVFYYFRSKAELFERVLERYYEAHLLALTAAYEATDPPAATGAADPSGFTARLHRLVDAYFDFIAAHQRYPRLIQQLVAGSEDHYQLIQRNLSPLFTRITALLGELTPTTGPLAARHFFVTLSGMVINYFTYAPVFGAMWGEDPLAESALAERRQHLHWMADTILTQLVRDC